MAAGDRGQQAAAVDDGELAVGPDVMQAGRRRVQAEARRRTAGESERKRAVGAGGGERQVRARFLVEGAVVARHRRHQVEAVDRSEEHTSELRSLMRISYAV